MVIKLKQDWPMIQMSHARAAVNSVNRCNMTLIPQPGKEKMLLS